MRTYPTCTASCDNATLPRSAWIVVFLYARHKSRHAAATGGITLFLRSSISFARSLRMSSISVSLGGGQRSASSSWSDPSIFGNGNSVSSNTVVSLRISFPSLSFETNMTFVGVKLGWIVLQARHVVPLLANEQLPHTHVGRSVSFRNTKSFSSGLPKVSCAELITRRISGGHNFVHAWKSTRAASICD